MLFRTDFLKGHSIRSCMFPNPETAASTYYKPHAHKATQHGVQIISLLCKLNGGKRETLFSGIIIFFPKKLSVLTLINMGCGPLSDDLEHPQ